MGIERGRGPNELLIISDLPSEKSDTPSFSLKPSVFDLLFTKKTSEFITEKLEKFTTKKLDSKLILKTSLRTATKILNSS